MRLLTTVIGMVKGLMQAVGLVRQVQDTLNGGSNPTAADTQPRKSAKTSQKRKQSPVQADTKEASQKRVQKTALQTNGQVGNKQEIPAQSQSGQKLKRSPVQSTKPVKSSNKERSQQTLQGRGKQSATPASKTRHHAKSAVKRKP